MRYSPVDEQSRGLNLVFSAALLAGLVGPASAEILHVPAEYPTIQAAMSAATNGDEIVIADGEYSGPGFRDIEFRNGVTVRSASGDPLLCTIDLQMFGRAFVFDNDEDESAILDGIRIINGFPPTPGGALYIGSLASPTIRSCRFDNCMGEPSGGAVYIEQGAPSFTDCTFYLNTALEAGGAVYIEGGSPSFNNCAFDANQAYGDGGGLYASNGAPDITFCDFTDNIASGDGGGIYYDTESEVTISDSDLTYNTATNGGAISAVQTPLSISSSGVSYNSATNDGGAVSLVWMTALTANAVAFQGNDASRGGAIAVSLADVTLDDCTVENNSVDEGGGAIFLEGALTATNTSFNSNDASGTIGGGAVSANVSVLTLTGCSFTSNEAATETTGGGAVCLSEGDLTATGCTFDLNSAPRSGGALYLSDTEATITACTFAANTTTADLFPGTGGGAISADYYSGLTLFDCEFTDNLAAREGGALRVADESSASADGCTLRSNRCLTGKGGGICVNASDLTLTACTFESNETQMLNSGNGGGVSCAGGVLYVSGCTFSNNMAHDYGGALAFEWYGSAYISNCMFEGNQTVYSSGGAMFMNAGPPTIEHCTFRNNHAGAFGGAVSHFSGYPLTVIACDFVGNSSVVDAGAIVCDDEATVSHCRFAGNHAGAHGGAIEADRGRVYNCMFSANTAKGGAGAVAIRHDEAVVASCTFRANIAGDPLSGAVDGPYDFPDLTYDINNCVFRDNAPAQIAPGLDITVQYSDVQGGWGGEGNIDADPLFIDPDGPDGLPGTEDDNLRLLPLSPCIDAADNTAVPPDEFDLDGDGDTNEPIPIDLDGDDRFVDDPPTEDTGHGTPPIVDMGAYEFQACPADFDHDDDVDTADLLHLLAAWGTAGGDTDYDGDTDTADLLTLLGTWGSCP